MSILTFIPTHTPRLYDPGLSTFKPQPSYEGAKVRIRVRVPEGTADYWQLLERARADAEKKFRGATIYTVPEFEESENALDLNEEDAESDEKLVEAYVARNIPRPLARQKNRIVAYVCHKLALVGGVRRRRLHQRVKFLSVEADNFLSFASVKYEFKPGVTLVEGRNRDWQGGSNGSGKTNFLQLVRAALYGSTTKGQQHDALVHRKFREEKSRVAVSFKTDNAQVQVIRQRNPVACQLLVNGGQASSGNRKTKQQGTTEDLIVRAVGMSESMFDHSVLIDQKLVNTTATFLSGTDKEKKELLDAFLGTERFLQAGELVHEDVRSSEFELDMLESKLGKAQAEQEHLETTIDELKRDSRTVELRKSLDEYRRKLKALASDDDEARLVEQRRMLDVRYAKVSEGHQKCYQNWANNEAKLRQCRNQLEKVKSLARACPLCCRPVSEKTKLDLVKSFEMLLEKLCEEASALHEGVEKSAHRLRQVNDVRTEADAKLQEIRTHAKERLYLRRTLAQTKELLDRAPTTKLLRKNEKKLRCVKRQMGIFLGAKAGIKMHLERLAYAEKVLSRDGLVTYLYSKLCTRLNKAAEFYSEVLADKVMGLRFVPYVQRKSGAIVNEFDVRVINAQGGETRKDQSRGEEQLACVICLLALRSIGPECNLLILDEPAEGLEPRNADRFAEGLSRLTSKFETILLATHNENLKAHFASDANVIVVKKNRVSAVEEVKP